MIEDTIGFIGGGQMARALAGGFAASGLVKGERIFVCDPHDAASHEFCMAVEGARPLSDNRQIVEAASVVFIAVKPQSIESVFREIADAQTSQSLFVSIVAGVTIARLARGVRTERVARMMPNTPCLIGRGAAGFCLGLGASQTDGDLIKTLVSSVAYVVQLPETRLDAVTGLSGSGPAYVYQMIEALADGGVRLGLPRDVALHLAASTVAGSAEMVVSSGDHPAVLKDRVTSPGGTTIAGLASLESHGFRAALIAAVEAAAQRSRELGSI